MTRIISIYTQRQKLSTINFVAIFADLGLVM